MTTYSRFIFAAMVALLISTTPIYAQIPDKLPDFAGPNFEMPANTVNCFDYYTFGSVQADFSPAVSTVVAGTKMSFSGHLDNNNPYPIVNGKLIVKIFKIHGDQTQKNIFGPDVVDEFVAMDNVTMRANGSTSLNFTWIVPGNIASGEYKAVTFFTVADKFNLLGLSFTDDVVGNTFDFKIIGNAESVYFNKSTVTVDGNPYYFAAYPPRVDTTEPITVTAEVVNGMDTVQNIPVVWQVYAWDSQNEENRIVEYKQMVEVGPRSKTTVSYKITDNAHPVYYVKAQSLYKDVKSILGIRFVRREINTIRINFPSILKYPLQKGEEQTLFSCLHSVSDTAPTPIGTLKLTLEDTDGHIIHEYTYKGPITGMMMGVADRFVPEKEYKDFKLKAEISDADGKLIESVNLLYSCELIDPSACGKDTHKYITLLLSILAALVVLAFFIARRRTKTTVACLAFIVFSLFGPKNVLADDIQWNQVINRGFSFYYDSTWDSSLPSNTISGWHIGLLTPNVTVRYSAEVKNVDTNEILSSGANLQQGSRLDFTFKPHLSTDISWFGTGFSTDSPYGEWGAVSSPPAVSCLTKDFVNYDTSPPPLNFAIYVPLVIEAPVKQLTNTTGMSCVDLNSTTKRCTVTDIGNLNPTFSFAATTGKFFFRLKGQSYFGGRCVGNNVALQAITSSTTTVPYDVVVPQQTISYSFTSVTNSQPPTNPIITGNTTGYTGQTYTFGVVSTDPDNDQLKYGIDWSNTGNVSEWVPGSGYVPDETVQTTTSSWSTPGTYTFKAKAQDSRGANSGWTSHTITILADRCTNLSGVQSAPAFQANGRDYFHSLDDGKLYFSLAGSGAGVACSVDMCADTSAIEAEIPEGYQWDLSSSDPYTRYSCVLDTAETCSCVGRNYTCMDNGVQTSQITNAAQCALTAICTYPTPVTGNQVTFTFSAINVLGALIGGGASVKDIPTTGSGTITETRTLSDNSDGQASSATCQYAYANSTSSPRIINFSASKIVEKGQSCVFSWETQDMTSCTLGGVDYGVFNIHAFPTTLGNNISKILSCISNEVTPRTFSDTRTCLVKPSVVEK
ncbi:MAG: hypothetical protein RJB39_100 [Candidatus Parcubacteria bacterium]|jgi:hypothetical protein